MSSVTRRYSKRVRALRSAAQSSSEFSSLIDSDSRRLQIFKSPTRPQIFLPIHPKLQSTLRTTDAAPRKEIGYANDDGSIAPGTRKAWFALTRDELCDGLIRFPIFLRQAFSKNCEGDSRSFKEGAQRSDKGHVVLLPDVCSIRRKLDESPAGRSA